MRKINFKKIPLIATLIALAAPAFAGKLDTDKKKASYAIGQQIAQSFKTQNVDIDVDVLASSIKDSIAGKKSNLTPEEMTKAMQKLQESQMAKEKASAEKNKNIGKTFLEANKKKPDIKVTSSGLQYKVLKEGKGDSPNKDDSVMAHYKGTFIDGKEFDSSYSRGEPAEFPVSGVIPGWTEALLTMKPGEKRALFIPSELAYGDHGRPGIPGNSTLLFDVELISVKKATKAPEKKK